MDCTCDFASLNGVAAEQETTKPADRETHHSASSSMFQ